jgi:hypothetical protein
MKATCKNPNCGREFKPKNKRNIKYCSSSCAAKVNNRLYPKRIKGPDSTCKCGQPKCIESIQCHECKKQQHYELLMSKPMSDYIHNNSATRAKYNSVRTWARRTMERHGPKKECSVCGFDIVVEVCHIKSITEFSEDALMGEVNALDNLVYLCPNHHAMFDRGLIILTKQAGRVHILTKLR